MISENLFFNEVDKIGMIVRFADNTIRRIQIC